MKYNGYSSDIYSLGVCLFALYKGCMPFDKYGNRYIISKNEINTNIHFYDLTSKIFNKECSRVNICDILSHSYLGDNC